MAVKLFLEDVHICHASITCLCSSFDSLIIYGASSFSHLGWRSSPDWAHESFWVLLPSQMRSFSFLWLYSHKQFCLYFWRWTNIFICAKVGQSLQILEVIWLLVQTSFSRKWWHLNRDLRFGIFLVKSSKYWIRCYGPLSRRH